MKGPVVFTALLISASIAAAGQPADPGPGIPPPAKLPRPFESANFAPTDAGTAKYFEYLRKTALIPDESHCSRALRRTFGPLTTGPLQFNWVTKPYMAWGGDPKTGKAVVGPLDSLFTIREAFVTYTSESGKTVEQTFSCGVMYARALEDRKLWKKGFVHYAIYWREGHRQYPIQTNGGYIEPGKPGIPGEWDPVVRYYGGS